MAGPEKQRTKRNQSIKANRKLGELNIGPATPIGRGSQELDPGAHDVARAIVQGVTSILPLGAIRGITGGIPKAIPYTMMKTPAARKMIENKAFVKDMMRKAHEKEASDLLQSSKFIRGTTLSPKSSPATRRLSKKKTSSTTTDFKELHRRGMAPTQGTVRRTSIYKRMLTKKSKAKNK